MIDLDDRFRHESAVGLNRRHCIALAVWAAGGGAWAAGARPEPPAKAKAKAARGPVRLLVVGDSLSAEYGIARGSGWVALLEQRLQRDGVAASVRNASISGDTTSGGRSRLAALLKDAPTHVVIELGGNDALRGLPLDMTEANLREMVRASRAAGARVLLVGMQVPPNYGAAYGRDFEAVFGKVAKAEGAALVPFLLKGVADDKDPLRWFQDDRIHPKAEAHPRMLDNVWPVLRPWLEG